MQREQNTADGKITDLDSSTIARLPTSHGKQTRINATSLVMRDSKVLALEPATTPAQYSSLHNPDTDPETYR